MDSESVKKRNLLVAPLLLLGITLAFASPASAGGGYPPGNPIAEIIIKGFENAKAACRAIHQQGHPYLDCILFELGTVVSMELTVKGWPGPGADQQLKNDLFSQKAALTSSFCGVNIVAGFSATLTMKFPGDGPQGSIICP